MEVSDGNIVGYIAGLVVVPIRGNLCALCLPLQKGCRAATNPSFVPDPSLAVHIRLPANTTTRT
jgi:hypothetical protein